MTNSKVVKGIAKTIDSVLAIILLLLAFSIASNVMVSYTSASYTIDREIEFNIIDLLKRYQENGFIYQGVVDGNCSEGLILLAKTLDSLGYSYILNLYTISDQGSLEYACTVSSNKPLSEEHWYKSLYIPPKSKDDNGYVLEVFISP